MTSIEEVLEESKKLFEMMKELLKDTEDTGAFIELCYAIAKWEEMDLHLEEAKDELGEDVDIGFEGEENERD